MHNPAEMPAPGEYDSVEEPIVLATMITPSEHLGAVMDISQGRRGEMVDMTYITPERVEIHYVLPLAEIVFDFFDQLKSRTKGYASLDYEPWGYQEANLVRVDVLLHGEPVDAFSTIVHRDKAYAYGKQMTERLKELIPRQLFDVAVQAAIGSKIDRARDREGQAQGRPRQVLRRRHHAQAQAAGDAEEGQGAHAARRQGRRAAGGVHRGAARRRGREEAMSVEATDRRRHLRARARSA